jgi:hypothetical protein
VGDFGLLRCDADSAGADEATKASSVLRSDARREGEREVLNGGASGAVRGASRGDAGDGTGEQGRVGRLNRGRAERGYAL